MTEIIHSFGNYSIRYVPLVDDGNGKNVQGPNAFVIPQTNVQNRDKVITHRIHGARDFTRQIWADIARSRLYQGRPVFKAALVYGGELKCPGRHMLSDGTWYEAAEADFKYETVDGGQIMEHFSGEGPVIRDWDPEPEPEPIVTAPEPEAPISVASVTGEDDPEPETPVDTEKASLLAENARLQQELAEMKAKNDKPAKPKKPKVGKTP